MNYFLDNFTADPAFFRAGSRTKNPTLKTTISNVAKEVFKEDATITNLILMEIPKYKFFHGSCFIGGKFATVFFFADVDVGLLSVVKSFKTSETMFLRFSSIQVGRNKTYVHNPDDSTVH
jgi:hypothetical protein